MDEYNQMEEFISDMEIALCAHSDPIIQTTIIVEWMSVLQTFVRIGRDVDRVLGL